MANDSKDVAAGSAKGKSEGSGVPVRWPWLALGVAGLLVPLIWLVLGRSDGATGGGAPAPPMAAAPSARPNIRLQDKDSPGAAPAAAAPAPAAEREEAKAAAPPEPEKAASERRVPADQPSTRDARKKSARATPAQPSTGLVDENVRKATKGKAAPRLADAKPMADPVARGPIGPETEVVAAPPAAPSPPPPPSAQPAPAPAAPAPPPAASRMAPGAVATKTAPSKPAPPKPAPSRPRSVAFETDDGVAQGETPDPPKPRVAKRPSAAGSDAGEGIGLGTPGTIGHGAGKTGSKQRELTPPTAPRADKPVSKKRTASPPRSGKGRASPPPPPSPEPEAAEGAEAEEDADSDLASLKPGWFGAKIPEQMNLNESTRVRVTVTREENKAKGKAKLEAMAPTHLPAKTVEQDILVGKFLRVELRAFASEFEILAITPAEQRLIAGRVTTWEWAVVPRQPGPHDLSVVVTNLTDARGNPIDLTVHAVSVEVQVKTMQKLRDVASLISSAMGGLMSLLGMYKGILAPLLNRRREKDGEASKDKSKDPPKEPPKDRGPDGADAPKSDSAVAAATGGDGSKSAS